MNFTANTILLVIIVVYLIYSLFKTNKKTRGEAAGSPPKTAVVANEMSDYEKHVLAAVISATMQDKKYIVKRVFAVGTIDEKKSAWRVSGRQENMNRRLFLRKK